MATIKDKCLPSRFWWKERAKMYTVVSRSGTQVEILLNEKEIVTQIVEESEGDRMDWTTRRDCNGDDVYALDIVQHTETDVICLVQKLCDKIRCTEFITCLEDEDCTIKEIPFDMSKYKIIGNFYVDRELLPSKLQ